MQNPSKRQWYFEPEDSHSDSESDLESYYDTATKDRTAEDVRKFISVAFKRCLSHQKRKELAREYPKPQVAKAPETDPLLADFLGKRYPVGWRRLFRAGVDTNIFKVHSTRTASTSAAKARRVSTADIMKAADWSWESTFTRFYYIQASEFRSVWSYHSWPGDHTLNHTLSYMQPCNIHGIENLARIL